MLRMAIYPVSDTSGEDAQRRSLERHGRKSRFDAEASCDLVAYSPPPPATLGAQPPIIAPCGDVVPASCRRSEVRRARGSIGQPQRPSCGTSPRLERVRGRYAPASDTTMTVGRISTRASWGWRSGLANTHALSSRAWLQRAVILGAALLVGGLAAKHPNYAVGLAAVMLVTLLAFIAPVTHLTILIALTTIVPYPIEGQYHLGGAGAGNAGLQASDLFLLTGLLRAAIVLPRLRLTRRQVAVVALVAISCLITIFEAWQGFHAGQSLSNVGAEFRYLAGGLVFVLVAMTTLEDHGAHRRVLKALALLGLALGLWGIAQWTLGLSFNNDFGVRSGVSLTTGGVGQLQGGLFVYPVAVTLAVAVLASRALRTWRQRAIVWVILALNAVSLLLTFERTFWVATAVAILLVAIRSGRRRRVRALLSLGVSLVIGVSVLAAVSPNTLLTAEQRLLSIGQYQTDLSVRYRNVESGFVLAKIRAKPLLGWGLADTIFWGQPWTQTPPAPESYTHVGYLWLLWREGILGTGVLLLLLGLSCVWPGRARDGDTITAVKVGAQISLVAMLIVNVTFPVFSQGSQAVYMVGFLVAYCAVSSLPRRTPLPRRGALAAAPALTAGH